MRTILIVLLVALALPAEAARKKSRRPSNVPPGSGDTALLQKVLAIEDQRLQGDRTLVTALRSPSRRIAKAAFLAIGRNRDESAIDAVAGFLNKKDRELKKYAAYSLGLMGTPTALKILQQHLQMQRDSDVIAALLQGVGRAGNESSVNTIAAFLRPESSQEIVEAACHALGILWGGPSEKWAVPPDLLTKLATYAAGSEPIARAAAFALSRFKGEASQMPAAALLEAATKARWPETRALLCRVLGKAKTADGAMFLATELANPATSPAVRIEAAKALALHPASEVTLAALRKGIEDPSAALVYQSLEAAFNLGAAAGARLSDTIESIFRGSSSLWLKGAALKTLAGVNAPLGRQKVKEVLAAPNSPLVEAAVSAMGFLGGSDDLDKLVEFVGHTDVRVAQAAIEAFNHVEEKKIPASARPALRTALEKGDTALTALVSQLIERHRWKDLAVSLARVYPLLTGIDQIEAKLAVLHALAVVGDQSHLEVIQTAMADNERLVVEAAIAAKKAITGQPEKTPVPAHSEIEEVSFANYAEAVRSSGVTIVLKTSRGEIHMRTLEHAPLTSWHILNLVKKGFYDGKTFHRVVPNFVVQGGDPRGDGYGGPGYLIRDEVGMVSHERTTVGIATAGPDTGGCQFFFNLGPNLHLDAKYTAFAEVTEGMDVVDRLEVGDRIVSARVK